MRRTTVSQVEMIAPKMKRITVKSDELRGFTSLGFDDHVKLIFPNADGQLNLAPPGTEGASERVMRDFTPRRFDAEAGELVGRFRDSRRRAGDDVGCQCQSRQRARRRWAARFGNHFDRRHRSAFAHWR